MTHSGAPGRRAGTRSPAPPRPPPGIACQSPETGRFPRPFLGFAVRTPICRDTQATSSSSHDAVLEATFCFPMLPPCLGEPLGAL